MKDHAVGRPWSLVLKDRQDVLVRLAVVDHQRFPGPPGELDVRAVVYMGALANLSVMYEASHTISHILDVDQLLERIMDLIFRSIEADRGCIMLQSGDGGPFEPKAVRWRERPCGRCLSGSGPTSPGVLAWTSGLTSVAMSS